MATEEQEYYYDISYQRESSGPVGMMPRSDLEDVIAWLQENAGAFKFLIILRMPGSPEGLPEVEV